MVVGESGMGKEVVVCVIYKLSGRWNKFFIVINCVVILEQFLESELFCYVKGVFIGVFVNGKIGLIQVVNMGMLFFDEIGDMLLMLQVKLLCVIEVCEILLIGVSSLI